MKRLFISFIMLLSMMSTYAQQVMHTIQRGETLESIAKKYNVSVSAIQAANPDTDYIYVGLKLIIPHVPQQPLSDESKESTITESKDEPIINKFHTLSNETKVKEKKLKKERVKIPSDGELHLIADAFGGYSNFMCDEVTPEFGVGFGGDIGIQCNYSKLWGKLPQSLYGEITVGYAYRGSGAFPIHYAEARVHPIGYKHTLNSNMKIVGKAGMYVAYPFSELETSHTSYSTSLDFGVSAGIGVEWKQFGLMASYEHGFADVKDGGRVELYNQGAFLTLSYKIRTFK